MITRLAQHVLVVSALDARKIRQRRMRKSDRRIRLTRFAQQTFRCVEAARLETVRREPRDIAPRPAADVDRPGLKCRARSAYMSCGAGCSRHCFA
jgi:hypothetical protein